MNAALIDVLGWIGTALYLVAYALVSAKRVEGDSLLYQGMNILAGALLIVNTLYWKAYPSLGLNAAWIAIGLFTLGRKWLSR
ncbi:MAG: CBU_0592 family membrane protein [Chloroflexota bacterium]